MKNSLWDYYIETIHYYPDNHGFYYLECIFSSIFKFK